MSGGGLAAQVFVNRPHAKSAWQLQQVCLLLHSNVIISKAWRWRSIAYFRLCLYDICLLSSCLISQPRSFSR